MKFKDGTEMKEDDITATYSRRISIGKDHEVWQHSYINNGVLEDNPDLQIVCFTKSKHITTFYISQYKKRLSDPNHLAKMQLIFHDICEVFEEHSELVKNIYSTETDLLIDRLINETLIK